MPPYFELLPQYFPELTDRQLDQYAKLWDFYHYWNARINVISRKDIDELYLRHVLHSLSIAKICNLHEGAAVLDVGTGGGFPGIPLSIYFKDVNFTLVDSIGKKIKVVNEAIRALQIHNAHGLQIRAEDIKTKFDMVVSRAVAKLPVFVSWISDKIMKGNSSGAGNGIMYMKGGEFKDELKGIRWSAREHDISSFFREDFFETKKVVHLIKP